MSTLTKLFVGLNVVLSLLLAAGVIVFVNSHGFELTAARADVTKAQTQIATLTAANSSIEAANAQLQAAQDALRASEQSLSQQIATLQKEVADKTTALAQANSALQLAQAGTTRLTGAVQASEASREVLQNNVQGLRSELDKVNAQLSELNIALTETSNKLMVTEQQRRILSEQLAEATKARDQLSAALRDRGVNPDRLTAAGIAAGAPPINGVVRQTRVIGDIPHATISVGSDDAVKQGMEFRVLDRNNGKFLGFLRVTGVEPNEAVGILTGPGVNEIGPGNEVRTQF